MNIILASKSPRRKELLEKIIKDFKVIPSTVDESKIRNKDPLEFVLEAASAKAMEIGKLNPEDMVIGADTIVSYKGKNYGKPGNYEDALKMLTTLSGTSHKVITGIAIFNKSAKRLLIDYAISTITMHNITTETIKNYLDKNTFLDKAGSYAVQEIGDKFIESIDGEYENIVGLPIIKLQEMLTIFHESKK